VIGPGAEAFHHVIVTLRDRTEPVYRLSMKTIQVSSEFAAPVERVFAVASDFERGAELVSDIRRVEMLSEPPHVPVRVGTKFRETRTFMGKEASETMEVTSVSLPGESPDGSAVYVLEAHSHGTDYVSTVTVTPAGGGGSLLTYSFEATPRSVMAKLMSPLGGLMAKSVREAFARDQADIKAAAEAGEGVGEGGRGEAEVAVGG